MKEITISPFEAGQRFDKYLVKNVCPMPPKVFYAKCCAKNITLNRKKGEGSEKLAAGDVIKMFFCR